MPVVNKVYRLICFGEITRDEESGIFLLTIDICKQEKSCFP